MKPEDNLQPVKCPSCDTDCYWIKKGRDVIMVEASSVERPNAKAEEKVGDRKVKGNNRDKRGYRQFDPLIHTQHFPGKCMLEA